MRKLDYSQITDQLYVGRTPWKPDYKMLKDMGVTLVVNLRIEWPSRLVRRQKAIPELWVPSIDPRFIPLKNEKILKGAQIAAAEIKKGGKVYVYCRLGRHRSATMAAVILLLGGASDKDLLQKMQQKRPVIDPRAIDWAKKVLQ